MEIEIVNKSNNPLPAYQTEGSAGMDLYADLTYNLILKPMERVLVPTGLFIALPQGVEAQIRPRSGLAVKQGITCLNTPGTIDSDYRGEIKVILVNLSGEDQTIRHGDRIAQMVVSEYRTASWQPVTELRQTERGSKGFGSTGR
jgi:dUTP pyrophosphatase